MTIRAVVPRGTLTRDAVFREDYRLRELAKAQGYLLTPEPHSNLFVERADVTVNQILHADDPLRAIVLSTVTGEWRPEVLKLMGRFETDEVPYKDLGRSGGPYHQLPVKRIAKLKKNLHTAIYETDYLWRQPWWAEIGRPVMCSMLEQYRKQSLLNIDKIIADPQLAIGDKPDDTGTGWYAPWNNRKMLGRNIEQGAPQMRRTVDCYYRDLIEAIGLWPENDVQIQLEPGYKGISGGVRSDVDVVGWNNVGNWGTMELESTSREVGNDPSSAFHNKSLNTPEWRQMIWDQTTTPYHLAISDSENFDLVRATPPASIGGDPDDIACLGADFGYCRNLPKLSDRGIVPTPEVDAFGADQISLLGIHLNTTENANIMMMKSGCPFTMTHYNVVAGQAVGYWANKLALHLKILQVGDDMNILMPLHEIPLLIEAMGHSLRLKGMVHTPKGDGIFVLGKWTWWKNRDQMTSFITPRMLKSLTSAKRKEMDSLPASVGIGETYTTKNVDPLVDEQIKKIWRDFPELVYFSGTKGDYLKKMLEVGEKGYAMLAEAGVMEWMLQDEMVPSMGQATTSMSATPYGPVFEQPLADVAIPEVPIRLTEKGAIETPKFQDIDGGSVKMVLVKEEYMAHRIESAMKDTGAEFSVEYFAELTGMTVADVERLKPKETPATKAIKE